MSDLLIATSGNAKTTYEVGFNIIGTVLDQTSAKVCADSKDVLAAELSFLYGAHVACVERIINNLDDYDQAIAIMQNTITNIELARDTENKEGSTK